MRIFISVVALLVGIIFLIAAYFWASPPGQEHPLLSFLASNFGGLFIFTTAYTYILEHHLQKDFAREMKNALKENLNIAELHKSIISSGLTEIFDRYSDENAFKAMQSTTHVRVVIMRGNAFFRDYHTEIRERILTQNMGLEILLPNPRNQDLMKVLSRRYSDLNDGGQLAASISTTINTWIIGKIYNQLTPDRKDALKVYLLDAYPLYSAYVFDNKTLWYIPYHQRKDRQRIPVFVYTRSLDNLEIYKDVKALSDGITPYDLAAPMQTD